VLSIILTAVLAFPPQTPVRVPVQTPVRAMGCECLVCKCNNFGGCACGDKCDPPAQTVDPPVLRPLTAPACQIINGRLVCPTPQRYAPKTTTVIRRR
jgi:hypothetical protein